MVTRLAARPGSGGCSLKLVKANVSEEHQIVHAEIFRMGSFFRSEFRTNKGKNIAVHMSGIKNDTSHRMSIAGPGQSTRLAEPRPMSRGSYFKFHRHNGIDSGPRVVGRDSAQLFVEAEAAERGVGRRATESLPRVGLDPSTWLF
jgi:hypothetical protein